MRDLFFHAPVIRGFVIPRGTPFGVGLKILNETGDEISLCLDSDPTGMDPDDPARDTAWRGDLRVYLGGGDDNQELIEPIQNPTALDLLKVLATHLGYQIEPLR